MTRFIVSIFSVGLMVLDAGLASGQDYPNKPLRIVTGAAGGNNDSVARFLGQALSRPLGQPVIVHNRGGGGTITGEVVAKSSPDGYTLLLIGSNLWIVPLIQETSYDPVKDFSPISLMAMDPNVLGVHPSVPVTSVKELIALAKAKPGALNYGSGVTGAPSHLAAELFKSMAGVNIVRIPYKGGGPAVNALIAGEVQLTFSSAPEATLHMKSGKLRALAVTSLEPSALIPGLPTVAASGLPGFDWVGLTGIFAPGKTPAPIINRLNQEIVRFLKQPEMKERFLNAGSEIVASSPEQAAATIKSDIARVSKVVKDAGIKLN